MILIEFLKSMVRVLLPDKKLGHYEIMYYIHTPCSFIHFFICFVNKYFLITDLQNKQKNKQNLSSELENLTSSKT